MRAFVGHRVVHRGRFAGRFKYSEGGGVDELRREPVRPKSAQSTNSARGWFVLDRYCPGSTLAEARCSFTEV